MNDLRPVNRVNFQAEEGSFVLKVFNSHPGLDSPGHFFQEEIICAERDYLRKAVNQLHIPVFIANILNTQNSSQAGVIVAGNIKIFYFYV